MRISVEIAGTVKRFKGKGGWYYIPVPKKSIPEDLPKNRNGFIPGEFSLNETTWKSSLLPMGDGGLFVALKKEVRKAQSIDVGDEVKIIAHIDAI